MDTQTGIKPRSADAPTLVREIEAAIKRFNMYPAGHPASKSAAEVPYQTLKKLLDEHKHVVLGLAEGRLALNGIPIEGLTGKIVVEEALKALNINSITFALEVSQDDFQKFLNYFVGKSGGKVEWNNLEEYIDQNSVSGISIDELRYELVGKDQAVVGKDAVVGPGGKAVPISSVLGDNPELVLGLLANKQSAQSGLAEKYSDAIDFDKLNQGIEEEISGLNDDQMMGIIVSSLRDHVNLSDDYDEVDMQEMLYNITEMLEKRNQAEMLPRIHKLAEELHLIDKKYIDLILDKRYSRKRLAFDELETTREDITAGKIDLEKFASIPKRFNIYEDEEYAKNYIRDLVYKVNSDSAPLELQTGFERLVASAVDNKSEVCLDELYNQVKIALSNFEQPPEKFDYYLRQAVKLTDWLCLGENLEKFKELLDVVRVYTSEELTTSLDKRQSSKDFIDQIGTNQLALNLVKQLEKNFESLNRKTFEVLKKLETQAVALRLCEYLTYSDRAIRLFIIRVLSEYKWASPLAFKLILADKNLLKRSGNEAFMSEESWRKTRNIVLVCGNIGGPEALEILEGLKQDPDPRLAEEMVLALEKIKTEKACAILSSYLYFNDSKIRLRAAQALGTIGNDTWLPNLTDAFSQAEDIRMQMIPIIASLGKEKALPFFRQILLDQKQSFLKSFLGKSSDEFVMQILSALIKIPSEKTLKLLDDYKKTFGRGLGALFQSNKLMVAIENVRRSIQKKLNR
ncbi:MAG: hypothetical protein GF404_08740 [candidate division Zixibacteria bacterium]|nr:hypothetical protein [candidate division Zixibacteria bacterium]